VFFGVCSPAEFFVVCGWLVHFGAKSLESLFSVFGGICIIFKKLAKYY